MEYDAFRRSAAEFVGAFTLIFIGMGAITVGADLVGVAFAHGLAIAVMVSCLGHVSGGHFNPAITFGFLVTRRIAPALGAAYMLAQVLGGVAGALVLNLVLPDGAQPDRAVPVLGDGVSLFGGVVAEGVLTFFLIWAVFATAVDPRGAFKSIAGLAIGLTITFDILAGGPLTGAAMNPARSLGPELVQNVWDDFWVYLVGPLAGGALAALVYDRLYLRPVAPVPVGAPESGVDEPRPGHAAADR